MTSALFWLYLLIASWDILTLFKILFVIVITDCHTQQGAESISLEPRTQVRNGTRRERALASQVTADGARGSSGGSQISAGRIVCVRASISLSRCDIFEIEVGRSPAPGGLTTRQNAVEIGNYKGNKKIQSDGWKPKGQLVTMTEGQNRAVSSTQWHRRVNWMDKDR